MSSRYSTLINHHNGSEQKELIMIGIVLRTLFSRFLLFMIMVVFFIPVLIFIMIPARWRYDSKLIFRMVDLFYWLVLKCSLLPITYIGLENIPSQPAIFAGNHQSSLDIPLMGVLARGIPHVWLAKEELMESPILRWILPHIAVLVDQNSPKKAIRSLIEAINLVNGKNRHMMIFPEGGRYTDGKVHEFFRGFVILAKKTGKPIVPVYIAGVNKVYPPDSFWVYYYPITVTVGAPFIYQAEEDDEMFKQRVYDWFVKQQS